MPPVRGHNKHTSIYNRRHPIRYPVHNRNYYGGYSRRGWGYDMGWPYWLTPWYTVPLVVDYTDTQTNTPTNNTNPPINTNIYIYIIIILVILLLVSISN